VPAAFEGRHIGNNPITTTGMIQAIDRGKKDRLKKGRLEAEVSIFSARTVMKDLKERGKRETAT